jgi:DmsE family decaheme c-type cytochrome
LPTVLVVALVAAPGHAQDEVARPTTTACADCHDDVAADLEWTAHGGESLPALPGVTRNHCEACHGDGTQHMEEGDPELITVPRGEAQHELCVSCHAQDLHSPSLAASPHAGNEVYCTSCHDVHPDSPAENPIERVLLRADPGGLCVDCHASQEASFERPYAHRLGRGGLECFTCHDPHGGRGERSLVMDRLGAGPCESCHTETRGPFVFPHVTRIVGGCLSCHEPHGSNNPKRLKRSRVEQLCLECHTTFPGGTLGSQPPSFHDLQSARYRNCTTCHVAVHGSSSSPALLK